MDAEEYFKDHDENKGADPDRVGINTFKKRKDALLYIKYSDLDKVNELDLSSDPQKDEKIQEILNKDPKEDMLLGMNKHLRVRMRSRTVCNRILS